jgi:hypothetical protein
MRTGLLQPSLYDVVLQDDGSVFDSSFNTAIITFYMRPLMSRTPVINGEPGVALNPPVGDDQFNVRYDWQGSDTAIEGEYMGWWGISIAGVLQETQEFPIIISDHGPGLGVPIGPVVDGIGQYMPITFQALRADEAFGDRYLQKFADRAKRETLGYVDPPDVEETYDPQLIDYLSKLAAKRLCTPARDYWGRQWRTRTAQSPVEVASYPDMLAAIDKLEYKLECELPEDLRQLRHYLPGLPVAVSRFVPISSLDGIDRSTIDPTYTRPPRTGGPFWTGVPFV